jgi:hypothetical protein
MFSKDVTMGLMPLHVYIEDFEEQRLSLHDCAILVCTDAQALFNLHTLTRLISGRRGTTQLSQLISHLSVSSLHHPPDLRGQGERVM